MKKSLLLAIVSCSAILIGCSKIDPDTPKEYFTQWNSCESLTALQEYVQDVTNPTSANYIKPEDRIATSYFCTRKFFRLLTGWWRMAIRHHPVGGERTWAILFSYFCGQRRS